MSTNNSIFFHSYCKTLPLVDPKHYFQAYKNALYKSFGTMKNKTKKRKSGEQLYSEILGLSPEELTELEEATSIKHLTCKGEIEPLDHKLHESHSDFEMKYEMAQVIQPDDYNLVSVKRRKTVNEKVFRHYNLKYGHYSWLGVEEIPKTNIKLLNPFNLDTVVFCIKVYHPYFSNATKTNRVKLLQEIHILGHQTLAEFKDKIVCFLDYTGDTDISDDFVPGQNLTKIDLVKKKSYLSSFIFIEDRFFNETRHASARDLSKTIIEWSKEKKLGHFTSGSIENVKMIDLKIRIGQPYIYQHQGDCEHILLFSDVRFLQLDDPQRISSFPRVYAKGRCSGKVCMMCGVTYARWFVIGNARLTHDKSYFCSRCFVSYNYIDGKKVGNFKAYEYVDPIAVL